MLLSGLVGPEDWDTTETYFPVRIFLIPLSRAYLGK